jgi:FkbM family methyltransferase
MVKKIIKFIKFINNLRLEKYKKNLKKILDNNKIIFIDIGAAIQIIPRWKRIDKSNLKYILFEPNHSEFKKLNFNKKYYNDYKAHNFALSNKNKVLKLYITKGIYQSSVLKPNLNLINQFPNPERYSIIKKELLNAKSLDYLKIKNADFIKIDAQGYNYQILNGSTKTLEDIIGIETEVEFAEVYKKQKLFGDISLYLKKKNFDFIDFTTLKRWNRINNQNYGQCIFGNALFLKKPIEILKMNENKIIKYIAICILYNQYELVDYIIKKKNFSREKIIKISNNIKFFKSYSNKSRYLKKFFSILNKIIDFESEIHLFQ